MTDKFVYYIDRQSHQKCIEKIYYEKWLRFFYGNILGKRLLKWIAKWPLFSKVVGYWFSLPFSKKKILPFVKRYQVNIKEFSTPIEEFKSFNDFFIRTLKSTARPLDSGDLIIPADGRYLVYPNISLADGFIVKGEKFCLGKFLGSQTLAAHYQTGSLVLARLCPTDYHRFHFPCDCTPTFSRLINGFLYSVNPLAIRQNINILTENKRTVTHLKTACLGDILFCEIGATNVGSISQTYIPEQLYKKGDEKGFFSFGGSALLLLFEPERVTFSEDLLFNSLQHIETLCLMGQSLGKRK